MSNRAFVWAACALSLPFVLSCASEAPAEPLAMRVLWGVTETSALPSSITNIQIVTCVDAGQEGETCSTTSCSVGAISPVAETEVPTCRPRAGTEMYDEPVLVRRDLPTGTPIRFELRGEAGGELLYVGHAGPFVLVEGERRQVDLRMYAVGASTVLSGVELARAFHTATRLPDGRILVAGGFESATPATCPEGSDPGAHCFELVASDRALAFDPTSAEVEPIRGAMLAARAGHTATALSDGRVLIAGGAPRALLEMIPQASASGFRMEITPLLADGAEGAHASFAIFDPFVDGEEEDLERDGDLGRGRFLGSTGGDAPAPLNQPRFLHAAAQVPSAPARVLLVGGLGGAESAETWEVFDYERTGGYGVYTATANRLTTPRPLPSAVGLGSRVWIFGGAVADSDADLAEIWSAEGGEPNGAVASANADTQFPSAMPGVPESHPEYALLRPMAASIDGGASALVVGWYGPRCEVGASEPTYATGVPTELCNQSSSRSFTVQGESGLAAPTSSVARAFGASTAVGCFQPGRSERYVVMTGGIANAGWTPQASIDIYSGEIDATNAATRAGVSAALTRPRFFHSSTGVPGFGVVTLGGMNFSSDLATISFEETIELVFLPRPAGDDC